MKKLFLFLVAVLLYVSNILVAQEKSNWSYDLGVFFFKSSVDRQPDELLYNPVFEKWEAIKNKPAVYSVSEYKKAFDPYPFNLSIGFDGLFRFKKYFMIKLGYCYTNTLGIGGKGSISYTDISTNVESSESKTTAFSSHQITYFLGPLLPINDAGAEIYMGFSMMSPTYVVYKEKYENIESGITIREYDKTFTGFFGNCRTVIGIQVPLSGKFRFGSELVFAYFNGLDVKSGNLVDAGFKFPGMQWNFTFRYEIK